MFQLLTIKNLPEKQIRILRQQTNARPIIHLVEDNGIQGVVKDFSVNVFIYRNVSGFFFYGEKARCIKDQKELKGFLLFIGKLVVWLW